MTSDGQLAAALDDAFPRYREIAANLLPGVELRVASINDAGALDRFNESIVSVGPPGHFMRQDTSFFEAKLSAPETEILLLCGGSAGLFGYSVLALCSHAQHPFAPSPLFQDDILRIGILFGTALDPKVRGRGLQRLCVNLRLRAIGKTGRAVVQATASPRNDISLRNMMACGFGVIGAAELLDGHPRFIVEASARDGLPGWGHLDDTTAFYDEVMVPFLDFAGNRSRMTSGNLPTGWVDSADGLCLVYREEKEWMPMPSRATANVSTPS